MQEQKYTIFMHTPLGKRHGTMTVKTTGNSLSGTINILERCEPFEGTVDKSGNCRITGRLVTLMRSITYSAVGTISNDAIYLLLQGDRNVFEISGFADFKRKEQNV